MDEKRSDLRAALRELAAEEAAEIGPHVGLKRLIAYRRGHLPAAEREALQEHLSLCPKCAERLLELRDFEAASAEGGAAGPESLRQDAWESLARRLPWKVPAVRPIAEPDRPEVPRQRRLRDFAYGAAAALLLAVIGFTVLSRLEETAERDKVSYRSADGPDVFEEFMKLEEQLKKREEELAAARRSLAEVERQLAAARAHIQDLEKRSGQPSRVAELEARVTELTSELEKLRRSPQAPDESDQIAFLPIEAVSIAPRFTLRGQEPPQSGLLQGDGAVNSVQMKGKGFTVALSLAGRTVYEQYRLELLDHAGKVLWAAHRPGKALLGDAGTTVSVSGLGPGLYGLRIEGLRSDGSDLLAKYLLKVEPPK